MKSFLRILFIGFAFVLLLVLGYVTMNYAPDISLEEMKTKWAYDNSEFLEMDGMQVHYRINGEGEPLVLIHGTGASLHTWEAWTKSLEKDFKVISLDMPAFGLTGPNKEGIYHLDYYAQFLNDFLEKIGIDQFSIAGNSLGGAIAWKYATTFPDKVKSMILIDAGGYPRIGSGKKPLVFRIANSDLLSKISLSITPKSMFKKSLLDVYANDVLVTDELVNRYFEMATRAGNRQAFVDRVRGSKPNDPSIFKTIKIPTLIMWGDKDSWIPVTDAYKFAEDIEGSELKIYKNVGHVPMEESPLQTSRDAKKFLLKNLMKEKVARSEDLYETER